MREALTRYAVAAFAAVGVGLFGTQFIAEHEGTGPVSLVEPLQEAVELVAGPSGSAEPKGAPVGAPEASTGLQRPSLVFHAYPDPGYGWEVPTICFGSTRGVQRGQTATEQECYERLVQDVQEAVQAVARLVQQDLTERQYEALVSFAYNTGQGNLARSTLLKRLNSMQTEQECLAVAEEFKRWVFSNGKRLKGLEKRRAEEAGMFAQGCPAWGS